MLCEEISSLKKAVVGKGGRTNGKRSNSFAYSSAQDTTRTTATGCRIPLNREEGEERRREVSSVMIAATEPVTGVPLLHQTEISSTFSERQA